MRTTMNLPDELFRDAKVLAAQERRTVTSIVEEALRRFLAEHERRDSQRGGAADGAADLPPAFAAAMAAHKPLYKVRPLSGRGELPVGLIDNNAALLDFMEGADAQADA